LEWGASEKFFKLVKEDTGVPHPADIGRPGLRDDCIKYLDAFRYLGSLSLMERSRPAAHTGERGGGHISTLPAIEVPYMKLKYLYLIQQLDQVELKHIARKQQ
jgi:hypothetical protein